VLKVRVLKLFCVFACAMSVIEIFAARDRFDAILGGVGIIVWPIALYGIHKRLPVAWKLGFAWIGFGSCAFASRALSMMPRTLDHPAVVAFVVISTIIVAIYWGYWWYRQKSYFSPSQLR
jgi:hypothetical protein